MLRPHVLRIHQKFKLGVPHVFKLAVQDLGTNPRAFLFESNTRFEWFNTQSVPSADHVFLIVTSTPRRKIAAEERAEIPPVFLDGGADGTTTFFITNDQGADPAPSTIPTTYSD